MFYKVIAALNDLRKQIKYHVNEINIFVSSRRIRLLAFVGKIGFLFFFLTTKLRYVEINNCQMCAPYFTRTYARINILAWKYLRRMSVITLSRHEYHTRMCTPQTASSSTQPSAKTDSKAYIYSVCIYVCVLILKKYN